MAPELEALYLEYKDRGFIAISLMGETNEGATPGPEDLQWWAENYGGGATITHPLVGDTSWAYSSNFFTGAIPSETLIAPGGVILAVDQFGLTGADFEEYLPY